MSPITVERDDLAEALGLLTRLSHDELGIVLDILRGLVHTGQRKYGPIELATDKRDWAVEAAEELRDAAVYFGALARKLRRNG